MNCATASTSAPPSLLYNLNSISPDLSTISTSLFHNNISIYLSHMNVLLCLISCTVVMFIPQWSHRGRGSGSSCRIAIFAFQCRYMKISPSLTYLCALAGHPSTRHATDFSTCGRHHIYLQFPSAFVHPPCLWHDYPMVVLHVVAYWLCFHCFPALFVT